MRSLSLTLLPIALPLLASAQSGSSYGEIQLYDDQDCTVPRGPPSSKEITKCLETNQSVAVAALSFPSCGGDVPVILSISDREGCETPSYSPFPTSNEVGQCLSLSTGAGIGSAAFICVPAGSVSTLSSPPTAHSTLRSSSHTSTAQSTPSSTPAPGQQGGNSPPGSGSSHSDRIAIGVGVSIPLAAIIIGILQLWLSCITCVRLEDRPEADDLPPPYPPPPYQ